jgi:glycosyltransferase involved in cell wall biosynthesis
LIDKTIRKTAERDCTMATYFIATIGGGGTVFRYFHSLGTELASRGHDVLILVDGQRYDDEDRESNPSVMTWPSKKPRHWKDAKFLHALINRFRPACIIGNFSALTICTLTAWLHRVPARVAWYRTLTKQIELDSGTPPWKARLLHYRRRMVNSLATHFIANSDTMKEDLQTAFNIRADRISILHLLLPEPPSDCSGERKEKLVYAGRLDRSKGLDILIRAIPIIRRVRPDVIVEFLGDGSMRRECERLAASLSVQDACRFLGARPLNEVFERMAAASVVVSPSRYEAFGNVNVEAHSVGTPVVASCVGGIRDIVVDGETGFLVPPENPEALAEKIILLLTDEDLRSRFGRAARERFEEVFSVRRIPDHADFFERIAGVS